MSWTDSLVSRAFEKKKQKKKKKKKKQPYLRRSSNFLVLHKYSVMLVLKKYLYALICSCKVSLKLIYYYSFAIHKFMYTINQLFTVSRKLSEFNIKPLL